MGDGVGTGQGPADLLAEPVEGDGFVAAVLARELEEHGTDEGGLAADGRAAEDVARPQRKRHVLDHVGQELEVVDVAHEVQRVVHLPHANGSSFDSLQFYGQRFAQTKLVMHVFYASVVQNVDRYDYPSSDSLIITSR